jgi:hypothetical protein
MKNRVAIFVLVSALVLPLASFAAGTCTKNGQELTNVTDKKTCKQQGGTWASKKTEKTKPPKKG